jgi:type VI secretion system protein ImpK
MGNPGTRTVSGKDPFDFDDDADKTMIRPNPGGRIGKPTDDADRTMIARPNTPRMPDDASDRTMIARPGAALAARDTQPTPFSPTDADAALRSLETVGPNPLIAAAAPLIALATRLRGLPSHDAVEMLRTKVVEELRVFQQNARNKEIPDEEVRYGHYALCALIDEVVLSTPWGSKSSWPKQSLVATFHNEVVSGNRMFEMAESLEARPNRSPNLLELIYLCISFGFEGRTRVQERGASNLMKMRDRVYKVIRERRGPYERSLSLRWKGIDARYQPISKQIPLWVFFAGFAVIALGAYAGLAFALASKTDKSLVPIKSAFAAGPAQLNRSAPPPPTDNRLYLTILDILKPDIDAGRVAVSDNPDNVMVRLKDKGLFASGSTDLDSAYSETMGRVAQATNLTKGTVLVVGHTDNQPIRSLRFPSNQALSEARAQVISQLLDSNSVAADRLQVSGIGDSQPVGDNTTDDGRRENRRVEVTIPKDYVEN